MSKQITMTVYRYEELKDKAKRYAKNIIIEDLLDTEDYFMVESLADFEKHVIGDQEYTFNELPDNICYEWDFIDYLGEYEGTKSGKWLINEFKKFLNDTWDNLTFEEKAVIDYTIECDLWFFKDGNLFNENLLGE